MIPSFNTVVPVLVVAAVLVFISGVSSADFPVDKVPRCNYGDTECIRKSAEFILSNGNNEITELDVARLDPIALRDIRIDNPGLVNVSLTLVGGTMTGLAKSHVTYVKGFGMEFDPEEFNEVEVMVPLVTILSPYVIDGKFFLIPIRGAGNTNLTFENLTLRFKFRSQPISRDGKLYFESKDMSLAMDTSKLFLNFDNLFNGDKFLNEQTNALLNRRSMDIFRETKRRIERSFEDEITERVNTAFSKYPYADYFIPGPPPALKVVPQVRNSQSRSIPDTDEKPRETVAVVAKDIKEAPVGGTAEKVEEKKVEEKYLLDLMDVM